MMQGTTRISSVVLLSFVVLSSLCLSSAKSAEIETGFLKRSLSLSGGAYHYQVYVPEHWVGTQRWPVILFLHGAGERGNDGLLPTKDGLGLVIRRDPQRVPAIVVFPQCREGGRWSDGEMEQLVLHALEQSMQEFYGDRRRVYLTGLSMGGYGTWYLAAKYPDQFAAIVPVAGRSRPALGIATNPKAIDGQGLSGMSISDAATRIGYTPTWVFHGENDDVVPVSESRNMVAALHRFGNPAKYTEYRYVGHASWNYAYVEPGLFSWMFSQRLDAQ